MTRIMTLPNKKYSILVTKLKRKIEMLDSIKADMIKKRISFVIAENVTCSPKGIVGFIIIRQVYRDDCTPKATDNIDESNRKKWFAKYLNKDNVTPQRYKIHYLHHGKKEYN